MNPVLRQAFNLPIMFDHLQTDGQRNLVIQFKDEAIPQWCMGLVLLRDEMISSMVIRDIDRTYQVEWTTIPGNQLARANLKEQEAVIEISSGELGYITKFFLEYLRDGIGSVNHLDIQFATDISEYNNGYVVLKVEKYEAKQLSPQEVRERLKAIEDDE